MSSTQQGNTDPNGGRRNKIEKMEKQSGRHWSSQEDAKLLAAVKDLVANGWKSDNGFRPGYLQKLEEAMLKEFPTSDIQASSHITSKLSIWKKNYSSLCMMLRRSGVGFNLKGDFSIDCEDDQWEQIKKCDVNAKSMRYRPWPMYEDWKEIFGKDRATGDNAEDLQEAVHEMMHESNKEQGNNGVGTEEFQAEVNVENISVRNDVEVTSRCHSEKGAPSVKSAGKGKKRKENDSVLAMAELFCELTRGTQKHLETISTRIGYQYDQDKAKQEAYMLLENIPGLRLENQFELCDIFNANPDRLTTFKGLPDDKRVAYLQYLLKKKV